MKAEPDHYFYTPAELAKRWRVSDQTVLNACRAGTLRHFRIGRQVRIHAEAVAELEREAMPEPLVKSDLMDNIPDYFAE